MFDDVGRARPAPDVFVEPTRRLCVHERCLVFEDSRQGIEAAKRAGMHVVDMADLNLAPQGLRHVRTLPPIYHLRICNEASGLAIDGSSVA